MRTRFRGAPNRLANLADHRGAALRWRLDNQDLALASPQAKQAGRAQDATFGSFQAGAHCLGRGVSAGGLLCCADNTNEAREGRIAERAASLELAGEKAVAVVCGRVKDRARLGRHRLYEHLPFTSPSDAAGKLADERERALLRAEVREAKGGVRVEYDTKRDIREIVPLGHHLRSDQSSCRRLLEAVEQAGDTVVFDVSTNPVAYRVRVEPENGELTVVERIDEIVLQALGPSSVARDGR